MYPKRYKFVLHLQLHNSLVFFDSYKNLPDIFRQLIKFPGYFSTVSLVPRIFLVCYIISRIFQLHKFFDSYIIPRIFLTVTLFPENFDSNIIPKIFFYSYINPPDIYRQLHKSLGIYRQLHKSPEYFSVVTSCILCSPMK